MFAPLTDVSLILFRKSAYFKLIPSFRVLWQGPLPQYVKFVTILFKGNYNMSRQPAQDKQSIVGIGNIGWYRYVLLSSYETCSISLTSCTWKLGIALYCLPTAIYALFRTQNGVLNSIYHSSCGSLYNYDPHRASI